MKRIVTLYSKANYSTLNGSPELYVHDESLYDVIGQAKDLRFQIFVFKKSATARASIKVYESAHPTKAPRDAGNLVTTIQRVATGPHFQTVNGPFHGRMEITLEIDDTGGPAAQDMDLEVFATLIIEE